MLTRDELLAYAHLAVNFHKTWINRRLLQVVIPSSSLKTTNISVCFIIAPSMLQYEVLEVFLITLEHTLKSFLELAILLRRRSLYWLLMLMFLL